MNKYPEKLIYYGHSGENRDKSDWQKLKDHLMNVASLSGRFAGEFGASEIAYLAGLHHDIGKYSHAFQKRIRGGKEVVDHSTAGAKECVSKYGSLYGMMIAYAVSGHHGEIPNWSDGSESSLIHRLSKKVEDYSAWLEEISLHDNCIPRMTDFGASKKELPFALVNRTRMIHSCLVDADYLDTEKAFGSMFSSYRDQSYDLKVLDEKLTAHLVGLETKAVPSRIRSIRKAVLEESRSKADMGRGLFSMTVPTGGGKTLSSMAFALRHAIRNGMMRIIYVIPYTSIIEQNAKVFSDILGRENVLEHHSSFDWGRRSDQGNLVDEDELRSRLGIENWSFPIIVTTNVQFFESFFSNRPAKTRKLHNVANSVIILDEAQMLPTELLIPTTALLNDLVNNYGSTVVLCTATQPELTSVFPQLNKAEEIVGDPLKLHTDLKRTEVVLLDEVLPDLILVEILKSCDQVLCIVNTRRHALQLFELLEDEESVFHLSARMTPVHRSAVIRNIKDRLSRGAQCRVISTPVIEAGVDIDFPVVYRALTGMDSIIQAAGRCNREGKRDKGTVRVFKPEEVGRPKGYLARLSSKSESIFRRYKDPFSLEALKAYYHNVYSTAGEELDAAHIMDLHRQGVQGGLFIPFREITDRYKIIKNEMVSIVIPFIEAEFHGIEEDTSLKEGQYLMDSIVAELETSEVPQVFSRQLLQFTVQIYRQEYIRLQAQGIIRTIGGFNFLSDKHWYDFSKGILINKHKGGETFDEDTE